MKNSKQKEEKLAIWKV